jgi:hypothetical protein
MKERRTKIGDKDISLLMKGRVHDTLGGPQLTYAGRLSQ